MLDGEEKGVDAVVDVEKVELCDFLVGSLIVKGNWVAYILFATDDLNYLMR